MPFIVLLKPFKLGVSYRQSLSKACPDIV